MKNFLIVVSFLLSITLSAQGEDDLLVLKGVQLAKKGKIEKAMLNFNKALEINPNNIDALFNKGFYFEKKEKFNEAINLYSKAIQILSKTILHVRRGDCYQRTDQDSLAIIDFTIALEVEPDDIEIRMSRASSYRKTEQYEEMLEDLGVQLKRNPDDFYTKANYVMALGVLERYKEALPMSLELTEEMPENMMHLAHYLVAHNYVQLGDLDNADHHIQQSFKFNPQYEYSFYARALVQLKRDDLDGACIAYKKSLSLGIELDDDEERELKTACE